MYPSSNVKMADAKTAKNSNQHVIIPAYTDKLFLLFLVLFLHAVSVASKFRSVGTRLLSGESPRIDLVRGARFCRETSNVASVSCLRKSQKAAAWCYDRQRWTTAAVTAIELLIRFLRDTSFVSRKKNTKNKVVVTYDSY